MALIKQVVSNGVHWRLPGNNPTNAANEMLRQIGLPDDLRNLFATLRLSGSNYEWNHPQSGWQPLKNADPIQRQAIVDMVADARKNIVLKGKNFGENLIKVPNDEDYVFFRADVDALRILFTGWGFENSRTEGGGGGRVNDDKARTQSVRIGFKIDGQMVPNRQFVVSAGTGALSGRQCVTEADGFFAVGTLKEGTDLKITDTATGKMFNLKVMAGMPDYVNDVSETATVQVELSRDGQPVTTSETVNITYRGNTRTVPAQPGAPVVASFSMWPGEIATVEAMGLTETRVLSAGVNKFAFNVETPPAIVMVTMRHGDGSPYVAEKVDVNYAGSQHTLITDQNGEARLMTPYCGGEPCFVSTTLGTQDKQLRASQEVLFEFKEIIEAPLETSIRVLLLHSDGRPIDSAKVSVAYNGDQYDLITDAAGECRLTMPYAQGRLCTVTTPVGGDQRILNAGAEETFAFTEAKAPDRFDYNIRFIDQDDKPLSDTRVELTQGTVNWPVTLDADGKMTLPYGAMETGKDIDVVIHSQSERISDIKFQLDPNEYEYVIQTMPQTSSGWIGKLILFLFAIALLCIVFNALTDWGCAELDPLVRPLF